MRTPERGAWATPPHLPRPGFVETVARRNAASLERSALELELTQRGVLADLPNEQISGAFPDGLDWSAGTDDTPLPSHATG